MIGLSPQSTLLSAGSRPHSEEPRASAVGLMNVVAAGALTHLTGRDRPIQVQMPRARRPNSEWSLRPPGVSRPVAVASPFEVIPVTRWTKQATKRRLYGTCQITQKHSVDYWCHARSRRSCSLHTWARLNRPTAPGAHPAAHPPRLSTRRVKTLSSAARGVAATARLPHFLHCAL